MRPLAADNLIDRICKQLDKHVAASIPSQGQQASGSNQSARPRASSPISRCSADMFVVLDASNSSNDTKNAHLPNDVCMFQRSEPNVSILLVYGLAVPTLASFGLCTNFINAVVFMRPKMTPSAFTYLAALSCLDCVSCLLITMTALSRSYFYNSPAWVAYDYQWQTPLFGISTGAANLILACVSLDRFIYLSRFKKTNGAPRFCRRKIARLMICIVILISIFVNLPYFFVFYVDLDTATCHVTDFYYSK